MHNVILLFDRILEYKKSLPDGQGFLYPETM